jgi:hypothetical protein
VASLYLNNVNSIKFGGPAFTAGMLAPESIHPNH